MAKTGNYRIPFDVNGNQLDYPGWNTHEWRDNHEFVDTITFAGVYGRGRSSVTFELTRAGGSKVMAFVSDFTDMVPLMVGGSLYGRFTFVKKGQNYGVKLLEQILAP